MDETVGRREMHDHLAVLLPKALRNSIQNFDPLKEHLKIIIHLGAEIPYDAMERLAAIKANRDNNVGQIPTWKHAMGLFRYALQ